MKIAGLLKGFVCRIVQNALASGICSHRTT